MKDRRRRSLLKAISWRIIGVIITFSVSLHLTGGLLIATTIGFADSSIKIFAYYCHERYWDKTKFWKSKK